MRIDPFEPLSAGRARGDDAYVRVVLEILAAWTVVSVVFCVGISRALRVMDLSVHGPQARTDAASKLPSDPAPTATAA